MISQFVRFVPYKKMYYFPLSPRLLRLYASKATANDMRWHAEHKVVKGEMKYCSDSISWKHFNTVHPDFAVFHICFIYLFFSQTCTNMFIYSTVDMRGRGSNEGGGRGRGWGGRRRDTLSHAEGLASTTPLEELHTLSIRPSTESCLVHSTSSTQAASMPSLPVGFTSSTMSTAMTSASGRTRLIEENGR